MDFFVAQSIDISAYYVPIAEKKKYQSTASKLITFPAFLLR